MELVARMVDITTLRVDAIVNAANEMLAPGRRVCGAIHAKAGPELAAACAALGGCPTGQARITSGFRLPAKHVIHAVGPFWRGGTGGEPELLASAYRSALRLAQEHPRPLQRTPPATRAGISVQQPHEENQEAMPYVAKTPKPPYYAVVFTSINADVDHTEHVEMYARLVQRASTYEGYLGIEPARNSDGTGVAAVYFKDQASIEAWAKDPEHQVAKRKGRETWYSHYMIRICRVEREYGRPDR